MTPNSSRSSIDVSVVIPAYNAAGSVAAAVTSALSEPSLTLEVIVVDDSSSDRTQAVVEGLTAADSRVRLLRMPARSGPAGARNAAIAAAAGEWLALLDADDAYEPRRLGLMVAEARLKKVDFLADNLVLVDAKSGRRLGYAFDVPNSAFDRDLTVQDLIEMDAPRVAQYRSIGFCKPIMRRDFLYQQSLLYDTRAFVGQDFVLYLEAVKRGARFQLSRSAGYLFSVNGVTHSTGVVALHHLIATNRRLLAAHGRHSNQVSRLLTQRHGRFSYEVFKHHLREHDLAGALRALTRVPLAYTLTKFLLAGRSRLGRCFTRPGDQSQI